LDLQRLAADRGAPAVAPPIVHEVVRAPGQPLDAATRAFMEPRFGHDFSRVRVHADARAAASARAVGARAYTVGDHVVLGTGSGSHTAPDQRRVLAHELTHVVQQSRLPNGGPPGQRLSEAGDRAEQEAERVAAAVADGVAAPRIAEALTGATVQRQADAGAPIGPATGADAGPTLADASVDAGPTPDDGGAVPAGPDAGAPKGPVCGPDVTKQVKDVVALLKSDFGGWSASTRQAHCDALDSLLTGATAWDIYELHNNAWIYQNYRPACATAGATPPCGSTVQVGSDCYYAGSPNYVIYGAMCKLCYDHYDAKGDATGRARFTQAKMEYWINYYKGTGPSGTGTPSGNFGPSRDWAIAGYAGWPGGGTPPPGDRSSCSPSCPTPYSGAAFTYVWNTTISTR
jgi:hypothetical protein